MVRLLPLLVLLIVVASGGYIYHRHTVELYEARVDARVERLLSEANLNFLRERPLGEHADRPSFIRAFLSSPAGEPSNFRVGMLQAEWRNAYPAIERLRVPRDTRTADAVLAAEVDDRFGAGSHAAMLEEAERYRVEAPAREARRQEERRLNDEWVAQYVLHYYRRHGRYPQTVPPRPMP